MTTDSTITIFNRRLNESRQEILLATVIKEATWFFDRRSSREQYADSEDSFSVRIPYGADTSGKEYVEPWEWKKLTDEQAAEHWTIQKDDIVARGELPGNVQDQTEIMSATGDSFVVNTFANNTIRGSDSVKHWRIGGG